jgi:DNA-binding transcriptional MerR regulator
VHPNTVRLYEKWGFIAEAERKENGYRGFTQTDLEQLRFARLALHGLWPGRRIRQSALELVKAAAQGRLEEARGMALGHARLVREEKGRAEAAAAYLEAWAAESGPREETGSGEGAGEPLVGASEAAREAEVSPDQLRNWERNRIVRPRRAAPGGERRYGRAELGEIRVVRTLILAGFSVSAVLRMTGALRMGRADGLREALDKPRRGEEILSAFDRWLSYLGEEERRAEALIEALDGRIPRG